MASEITEARIATAVAMLETAFRAQNPLTRAQLLAQVQYQAAWGLREAVADCQDGDPRRSWGEIGKAIDLPRETVWRQYAAGGPLVTVKPWQSPDSPLSRSQLRPDTTDNAIFAFRDMAGNWFGPADAVEDQDCGAGWLSFNPPYAPGSRFAGQELRVRFGPWDGDVTFHAPHITEEDTGRVIPIRATHEVVDWLLGDGETALRQAMTKVAQAIATTPDADPALIELVDRATTAQNPDLPINEFIAAAAKVAAHTPPGYRFNAILSQALTDLERAIQQRRAWDQETR
jgi:hypothetical protein